MNTKTPLMPMFVAPQVTNVVTEEFDDYELDEMEEASVIEFYLNRLLDAYNLNTPAETKTRPKTTYKKSFNIYDRRNSTKTWHNSSIFN